MSQATPRAPDSRPGPAGNRESARRRRRVDGGRGTREDDAIDTLRDELLLLLDGGRAHVSVTRAVAGIAPRLCGVRPPGCEHSIWQLVEHMRRAQADILGWCTDPRHRSPRFPQGLWPRRAAPTEGREFRNAVTAFRADLRRLCRVVRDPRIDLLAPIPFRGVSWLHELAIVAAHNSYHSGQIVQLRRQLGAWPR